MIEIFLPKPFSLPDILSTLTSMTEAARPASLPDHTLRLSNSGWLPLAIPQEGASLEGVVVPLRDEVIAGLAVKLDWRFRTVDVLLEKELHTVAVLLPDLEAYPEETLKDMEQWSPALFKLIWAELREAPVRSLRRHLSQILARNAAYLAAQTTQPTTLRSDIGAEQVNVVEDDLRHDGFFQFHRMSLQVPKFAGGMSETVHRELFVATDAAIVLPYDPARDRVLLIEQFRMGPFGRGDPLPFCLEPVAGRVDGAESPEETARRECLEEAGLVLGALEHVSSHYPSPGASTEYFHCYVGLCDLPDLGQGSGGLESEHEDIRTHVLDFDQAMDLTRSGEANIGPLVLCLLWLDRERPRLRGNA